MGKEAPLPFHERNRPDQKSKYLSTQKFSIVEADLYIIELEGEEPVVCKGREELDRQLEAILHRECTDREPIVTSYVWREVCRIPAR